MLFEGRGRISDSPYVEMTWDGYFSENYPPVCPADERWNMLFVRSGQSVEVRVAGPRTNAISIGSKEASEFLMIKFKLGTYIPQLPVGNYVNSHLELPGGMARTFRVGDLLFQIPEYENVETFAERLVRKGVLVHEPIVHEALRDKAQLISDRTLRRRFREATGLRATTIRSIERARGATALLEEGMSLADTASAAGYSDQSHMSREFKRYIGRTPAQVAGLRRK